MTIENIERIIELLPKNILGSNNKTRHFFYGNGNSLNDIKKNIDDANIIFDDKNNALIVEINTIINKDDLWKLYQKFEELSSILKVDYDGFEVLIDGEENQQEFLPFEDFFKPLSYIKTQLSNNDYIYLLFLGGNKLDGYFFECLSLVDDGNANTDVLDNTSRIFRQPIQGIFNPKIFNQVGFSEKKLPISFRFRLIEDNTTPKQIDEIYNKYNIDESENNSWVYALKKIVESKSDELSCKSTMQYQVVLSPKGKVKWGHLLPLLIDKNTEETDIAMPFGSLLDYNKLNAIFINDINELELIDKAYLCL